MGDNTRPTLLFVMTMSAGLHQLPNSGNRDNYPTLVFDISSVIDAVSDQLTNTTVPFYPTLKDLNVVVNGGQQHGQY
jgi:hypothetical protein